MLPEWDLISTETRMRLAREALRHATETIAIEATLLAAEMEAGKLADRGGPDALRLLAAMLQAATTEGGEAAGHA
jgi:hypothetical protein